MTATLIISATFLLLLLLSNVGVYPASGNSTTPLIPSSPTVAQFPSGNLTTTCHLDLSSELFGGVSSACSSSSSSPLDRSRCCPVLAAWLFAAHSRSSFSPSPAAAISSGDLPLMPDDDSQKCVDSLHSSLRARNVELPRVNDTCDTVLCFCGIRLHQIGRLTCPKAFNIVNTTTTINNGTKEKKNNGSSLVVVVVTKGVEYLERDCRNSSYNGCTRCLRSLEKLKGGGDEPSSSPPPPKGSTTTDRVAKIFNRDCQLMGLTWLLAKNKTLYIPTVSAVLRALLYSARPPTQQPHPTCSLDQDNMPLAVDSLQFNKPLDSSSSSSFAIWFSANSLRLPLLLVVVTFLF